MKFVLVCRSITRHCLGKKIAMDKFLTYNNLLYVNDIDRTKGFGEIGIMRRIGIGSDQISSEAIYGLRYEKNLPRWLS